jgi:pimeloyl-ACP methyl ester carboxylesterase
MPTFDRHTRRRIRLFKALQGRHLHEVYRLESAVQRDLADEAAYGTIDPDNSLLTPELHVDLRRVVRWLHKKGGRAVLGESPSSTSLVPPDRVPTFAAESKVDRGTVLIVPGGLASSLFNRGRIRRGLIWVNGIALGLGRFYALQLDRYLGPNKEVDLRYPNVLVKAIGAVPMLYDLLSAVLWISGWTPVVVGYDWRKDIENGLVAERLKKAIISHGAAGPVHIVTHSQGGMVARQALSTLASELGSAAATALVGKIIMLGPANYGAFVAALAIAGDLKEVPMAGMFPRPPRRVQSVLASFTALYQLMPWDDRRLKSLRYKDFDIRRPDLWSRLSPAQIDPDRLERALPASGPPYWAQQIDTTCFNKQITVILGSRPRPTPGGVRIVNGELEVHPGFPMRGDGWVPDRLAKLDGASATYRSPGTGHVVLPMAADVIFGIRDILNNKTPNLPAVP